MRSRLEQLKFIENKVFPQAGQLGGVLGSFQVLKRTLKKFLIGKNRKRGCTCGLQFRRKAFHGEIRSNQPARGGSFLQLRNDGGRVTVFLQRSTKPTRD